MTHGNQMWSLDREAALRKYHSAGLSFSAMAELLRLTRCAIAGKVARMKLPRRADPGARRFEGKINGTKAQKKFKPARRVAETRAPKAALIRDASLLRRTDLVLPSPLNITIENLQPHHCRYIAGDDRRFCGHRRAKGVAYCPDHAALCHRDWK